MLTTKKQKHKARKYSRGAEMLSHLGNRNIMLIISKEKKVSSALQLGGPESSIYNASVNNESNSHWTSRKIRGFAGHGHNSGGTEPRSELKKLSVERNQNHSRDG